ncbi:hypothetical protein APPUASWS_004475 [Arthrospira platensis str. Paraca]|nr:hypothetical protein APPUASWS_004475 [Arthrospira platensis str. Paraca]
MEIESRLGTRLYNLSWGVGYGKVVLGWFSHDGVCSRADEKYTVCPQFPVSLVAGGGFQRKASLLQNNNQP